jgi:hypothetical protein
LKAGNIVTAVLLATLSGQIAVAGTTAASHAKQKKSNSKAASQGRQSAVALDPIEKYEQTLKTTGAAHIGFSRADSADSCSFLCPPEVDSRKSPLGYSTSGSPQLKRMPDRSAKQ